MSLSLTVIESIPEFSEYRISIDAINKQSTTSTIFTEYSWLITWLNNYLQEDDKLQFILINSDENIIGFAPFYIRGGQELCFIGTGENDPIETCPEYLDIQSIEGRSDEVKSSLMLWLSQSKNDYSDILFRNCLNESLVVDILKSSSDISVSEYRNVGARHCIPLGGNLEKYIESLPSKSFRKKLGSLNKLIDSDKALTIDYVAQDYLCYDNSFEKLVAMHNEHWSKRGVKGAFTSSAFKAFHQTLSHDSASEDKLILCIVRLGSKPIAISYCMLSNHVCHYYQSGIDANTPHKYSPGYLVHLGMMRYCINNNIYSYDLMRGKSTGSYKDNFNAELSPMVDIYRHHISFQNLPKIAKVFGKSIYRRAS